MSSVEKGQMSAVETGQVSAEETGYAPSDKTKQVVLLQKQASVLSHYTMSMSQKSQLRAYDNVQVLDKRSSPISVKMARNGSRMVARI